MGCIDTPRHSGSPELLPPSLARCGRVGDVPAGSGCSLATIPSPANSPVYSPRLHRQFPPLKCQRIMEHAVTLLGSWARRCAGRQPSRAVCPWAPWAPGNAAACLLYVCITVCPHEAVGMHVLSSVPTASVLRRLQSIRWFWGLLSPCHLLLLRSPAGGMRHSGPGPRGSTQHPC